MSSFFGLSWDELDDLIEHFRGGVCPGSGMADPPSARRGRLPTKATPMSGTKKVLNFIKMCGHTKSHLGCRFCIEEAEPTSGNVAQTGRNNNENERAMEAFAVEGRTRRNEANAKILGEQQRAGRAQEISETMGATSCGHASPSFEPHLSPHAPRRSFEKLLRRAEVDGLVRRSLAGWASTNAQEIYTDVDAEDRAEALGSVVQLVKEKGSNVRPFVRPSGGRSGTNKVSTT